jgi:hypothetical protein
MELQDSLALIHPVLAIILVFPLLGMTLKMAWQTRQRRLKTVSNEKTQLSPQVGREHLILGRWLTGTVVSITLIALAYSIFVKNIIKNQLWVNQPLPVVFISLMFIVTLGTLVCLYRARTPLWRGIFATLSGAGVVILGCQEGVYRLTAKWYLSHYYYGIVATLLMIFSLAIVPDIYQDRSHRWRIAHTILNCLAILLFIGQGFTGSRDLLEIPLSWQQPYIFQCDWNNKTCPTLPQ